MLHNEYKVQEAIFKHHQNAFPFVKFVYVPNASQDATTGFFNKQMGLHPGAHDIHLFFNRMAIDAKPSYIRVGIFEVKADEDKRLTSSQNKYASEMHQLGAYHGYGHTVRQYHQTLKRWGLTPLHEGVKEPDLRTPEQKKADAYNLYAPRRPE